VLHPRPRSYFRVQKFASTSTPLYITRGHNRVFVYFQSALQQAYREVRVLPKQLSKKVGAMSQPRCWPQQVIQELKVAPRPHTLEFMRYDMNFNRLTLKWETLEEVRQQGKYVRDAREEVRKSCSLLLVKIAKIIGFLSNRCACQTFDGDVY